MVSKHIRWVNNLILAALIATLVLGGLCGCGSAGSSKHKEENGKPTVVTTIFPYYDFVRQIAGDKVNVVLLVGAGKDSHSFEPTPADVITIQEADLFVMNGGSMENWVSEVLESLGDEAPEKVLTMMDYVELLEEELKEGMEEEDHAHDHEHGEHDHEEEDHEEHDEHDHDEDVEYDEHIWTSPVNAIRICEEIEKALADIAPDCEDEFENNLKAYQMELKAVDEHFREIVSDGKRNLIVFGDKFPLIYFFETYGLDYRAAFSGCSSDTEPGAKTIAYLIEVIDEQEIPAVYHLELSSTRVCDIISEETGAEVCTFETCHNLTRRQFESGVTYLELMKKNEEALKKGLN